MYPMNTDFGWAKINEYQRMTSNSPPVSVPVAGIRDSLGRALVSIGSKLMSENHRVRVVTTAGH